jgi:hypothetical protein
MKTSLIQFGHGTHNRTANNRFGATTMNYSATTGTTVLSAFYPRIYNILLMVIKNSS